MTADRPMMSIATGYEYIGCIIADRPMEGLHETQGESPGIYSEKDVKKLKSINTREIVRYRRMIVVARNSNPYS
ncbi:MAG: hypothetical protein HPY71_14035 [Firmicutes bacterium]|nr:hypothetical protein [Bacillota bacterium]